jgi:hypothetical protein
VIPLPSAAPTTFDKLNAMHPLRPINDAIDLKNAEEMIDRLAVLGKRTKDQNDYLHTVCLPRNTKPRRSPMRWIGRNHRASTR